jgi:hypothetical protein
VIEYSGAFIVFPGSQESTAEVIVSCLNLPILKHSPKLGGENETFFAPFSRND